MAGTANSSSSRKTCGWARSGTPVGIAWTCGCVYCHASRFTSVGGITTRSNNLEYENVFYDGPLAGSVMKSTVPLLSIVVSTEKTRKVRGVSGARRIEPRATYRYEFDYQEQVEPKLIHRRFCIENDE